MPNHKDDRKLILIELNEINFDMVGEYTNHVNLPNWEKLLSGHVTTTSAEIEYEFLEPWIQWASVHTGRSAAEHGIFRLGDIVGSPHSQLFERLEQRGKSIGAISPMNAENRLTHPAYFIPDPWTDTPPHAGWWGSNLAAAVAQAVNDNAQSRLTPRSMATLALALIRFARFSNYRKYLGLAVRARGAPWRKALMLDLLLNDLHLNWLSARRPDFSALFLNAGAFIQHHYMFNALHGQASGVAKNPEWYIAADIDPFAEMLSIYDGILGDYLDRQDYSLIIATGLSQLPFPRVELYWRLSDHDAFLRHFGFDRFAVQPRMTRDFLIEFGNSTDAAAAAARLQRFRVVGADEPLFGEIDNRGDSVFVTLTFSSDIEAATQIEVDGKREELRPFVTFVAVKNGMHQSRGYAYWSESTKYLSPPCGSHVKCLHDRILQFFGINELDD